MPSEQAHAIERQGKKCGAKLRGERAGRTCTQWAMPNGRCRMHGGNAAMGMSAPAFKHGRYSKLLPAALAEAYLTAQNDPDLHSLEAEIQLADVRIADLLKQLADGGGSIEQARAALANLDESLALEDLDGANLASQALKAALAGGPTAVWTEIVKMTEHRRKLVETETRRKQVTGKTVDVDKVLVFMRALAECIRQRVPDQRIQRLIQQDMAKLGAL